MVQVKHASARVEGNLRQFLAAIIVNVLGMCCGVISGWSSPLISQLRRSETPTNSSAITDEDISWIAGFMCIGGLSAIPFCGSLVERVGRKRFGYLASLPILLSWLVALFATDLSYIFIARFLGGFGSAMCVFLIPIYVSEISSEEVRGALGSLLIFAINIGVLLAFVTGPFLPYKLFVLFVMTFPLIYLLGFFFMPETPVYLVRKGRTSEAVRSLMFLKGNNKNLVDQELSRLQSQLHASNQPEEKVSFLELFKDQATLRGLIISFSLFGGQQLSGITPMVSYAESIFKMSRSSLSPEHAAIIIGVIQIFGSYLSTVLIERTGRRPLILVSNAGMALCQFIVAAYIYLMKSGQDVSSIGWIPVTALSIFMIAYCLGMGPVPFVIASEVFRVNVVSLANTLSMFFLWSISFFIVKGFAQIEAVIGIENCFLIFGISCTGNIIFFYLMLPETKGRKREDIVAELAGNAGQLDDSYNEMTFVKDKKLDGKDFIAPEQV